MNSVLSNYLEILAEYPQEPTKEQIERAFKALSRMYHPDLNKGNEVWANNKMKELTEAKEILLDEQKRKNLLTELELLRKKQNLEKNNSAIIQADNQILKRKVASQKALLTVGGVGVGLLLLNALFSD